MYSFILDFLFPKRCIQCRKIGEYICTHCLSYISFNEHMVCSVCHKYAIDGITHPTCRSRYSIDGIFPSLVYKGIVKKIVYQFKYPPYLSDMKDILVSLMYESLIQKEQFYTLLSRPTVIVPVPIFKTRFNQRGYNQSQYLAKGLSEKFNINFCNCLIRTKNTKTQIGLTKEQRKLNIHNAFIFDTNKIAEIQSYDQVFLIDDVATSGATLFEAAYVLKKKGIRNVWGVTLAHGE